MKPNLQYVLLAALLTAGCGGGGGYDGGNNVVVPPPAGNAGFTSFIKSQIAQTSDTSDPTEVNDRQFEFDEDEAAFDDVL